MLLGEPRHCEIVDIGARKDLNVKVISPVDNLLESHFDAIWGSAYAEMLSWQHVHPDTQLSEVDGLREVVEQIQGQENFQAILERDILPARVKDYTPAMLDRLCYSGEVFWRGHQRWL